MNGLEIANIWNKNPSFAFLLIEDVNATMGSEVMLDLSGTLTKLKVPLVMVKIEVNTASEELLKKFGVSKRPSLVAVNMDFSTVALFLSVADTREA